MFCYIYDEVYGHAGHAIHPLTCALDTAKVPFHQDMEPPTSAYPHDISERQSGATNFDHPSHRMQQLPGFQQQPVWPVTQNASSYGQPYQQYVESGRAKPLERGVPPPAPRAAMEPWSDTAFEHELSLS